MGGYGGYGGYGGGYGGFGAYGHGYGGFGGYGGYGGHYARGNFGNAHHYGAGWGQEYNYYPNPDLLSKNQDEVRKGLPKFDVPLLYSPGRFSKGSPNRGSPRSTNSPSPQRKALVER